MRATLTLIVLAYRQENVIQHAAESALAQKGKAIEVIISDDASPDDTFEIIQKCAANYNGPHRIITRRNSINLGITEHLNSLIEIAQGELIMLMAGDDISMPDRAMLVTEAWEKSKRKIDLIASDVIDMGVDGINYGITKVDDLAKWKCIGDWTHKRPYVIGAGHTITKRLWTNFGPISNDCIQEDQVNTLRAILAGGAITLHAPLVKYRRGGISGFTPNLNGVKLKNRIKQQTIRHLALHQQWLRDAAKAKCLEIVRNSIFEDDQRELFIATLVVDPSSPPPISALLNFKLKTGLSYRIIKFIKLCFPAYSLKLKLLKKFKF